MKNSFLLVLIISLLTSCSWPKNYVTKNHDGELTFLKLKKDSTFSEDCIRDGIELDYEGTWTGILSVGDTIKLNATRVNGDPLSELIDRTLMYAPDTFSLIKSLPWDY